MFLEAFGAFIRKCPDGYAYGLEIRNPNYLNDSLFAFMEKEGIIPVLLEGYYMPPVRQIVEAQSPHIRKSVVLRLHGPDREGMEERSGKKWDRIVVPRDAELKEISKLVDGFLNRGVSVYVNVNNHYEGCAPLTIEKLRHLFKSG